MHPDPQVVERYTSDPLNTIGPTRARTANEVLRGFRGVGGKLHQITIPILAVHGTLDKTTSMEAVRGFCASVSSKDVTFKDVEGGYHEMLVSSPECEENAEVVIAWLDTRLGDAKPKL